MSLVEQLWRHVKVTQDERKQFAPPGASNLWADLNQARYLLHAQALEIGDLREAVGYLADVVEGLQARLNNLEGTNP